jgi:hypothetical protein
MDANLIFTIVGSIIITCMMLYFIHKLTAIPKENHK